MSQTFTGLDAIKQADFFRELEFPAGTLLNMDGRVILALDRVRRIHGSAISPSPLVGAHIRTGGRPTSQHYIGNGRLSTATDFFPHSNVLSCWLACQAVDEVGGIGIYLDTRNGNIRPGLVPMLHIDIRPRTPAGARTFWMRLRDGTTINPYSNNGSMKRFFEELHLLAES